MGEKGWTFKTSWHWGGVNDAYIHNLIENSIENFLRDEINHLP